MNEQQKKMIEEFQCPGCAADCDISRVDFAETEGAEFYCKRHIPGTVISKSLYVMRVCLGLPKGFCKVGAISDKDNQPLIRLWLKGTYPNWNDLNVPVWALEKDGYLFARTYMPRINDSFVDIVEEGLLSSCPTAIDVSKFYDEID